MSGMAWEKFDTIGQGNYSLKLFLSLYANRVKS